MQVTAFKNGISATNLDTENWSTHEWLHFMGELPEVVSLEQMQDFDKVYDFTNTENSEIASAWFLRSIKSEYETAYPKLKEFLFEVGRGKFLYPLYEELAKTKDGKKMGKEIYEEARPNYHPITQRSIDAILN